MAIVTLASVAVTLPMPGLNGRRLITYDSGVQAVTAANIAISNVIQLVRLPLNAQIVGGSLTTSELDVGADALVLDVGYGGDVDAFLDGTIIGQTGGTEYFGGNALANGMLTPVVLSAEDTIDALVAVAAGTAAAGNMRLIVHAVEALNS